jgi:hypothetical protein
MGTARERVMAWRRAAHRRMARRWLTLTIGVTAVVAGVTTDAVVAAAGHPLGRHATNADGTLKGPFLRSDVSAMATASHAPKHADIALGLNSMSCPQPLGPNGAFESVPGRFHYSDGVIVGGYRAMGSDGKTYEIFGGVHLPVDVPVNGPADTSNYPGFILIEAYSSSAFDPCKVPGGGSDGSLLSKAADVPSASSGPVSRGSVSGDLISYTTPDGATGSFDFVTQTFVCSELTGSVCSR